MAGKNKTGPSAQAAASAPDPQALEQVLEQNPTAEDFCAELAKVFHVRQTEVALLRLDKTLLKFVYPAELATAGSIPISSSNAVAAHTATTKTAEIFNTFAAVKHASIFESIKLTDPQALDRFQQPPIQKLMSSPVLNQGKLVGVIQISRKGQDLESAGPDFTAQDLQNLGRAAKVLAKAAFMQAN